MPLTVSRRGIGCSTTLDDKATSFGVLPTNLKTLPAQARFDDVATPPMRAIRSLARAFEGSVPMRHTDALAVEVTSLGPQSKVFEGDETHPPLWHHEVLAVLPFQVRPRKHAVVVYVMTRDATRPFPPETFRLTFAGVKGSRVQAFDVLSGSPVAVQDRMLTPGTIEITMAVTDRPSVLAVGE